MESIWKLSVGTGYSSVAVSDGRVYAMGNKDKADTIYCLDPNTGDAIWKHSYPCVADGGGYAGSASTPTVDGKYVYTLSREGHFLCVEADSGKIVWSKHLVKDFGAKSPNWGFASSVLILDSMAIVDAVMTLAVDKLTGDLIWKTKDYGDSWGIKAHGGGYSTPYAFELNGSQRLAVFNSSGLMILDPKNGQELMLHPWRTDWNVNAAIPTIALMIIYVEIASVSRSFARILTAANSATANALSTWIARAVNSAIWLMSLKLIKIKTVKMSTAAHALRYATKTPIATPPRFATPSAACA